MSDRLARDEYDRFHAHRLLEEARKDAEADKEFERMAREIQGKKE